MVETIQTVIVHTPFTPEEELIIDKMTNALRKLNTFCVEREDILEAQFIALLCKQHQLLIGPPGTAKSYSIECFGKFFEGFKIFSWQVTKFTTPEEIFGPYNIMELKNGKYVRITDDKLSQADLVYLDEVFNGNSSILNALNSTMNEKVFENNDVPLQSLYGATNFIPEEKILVAFFDRFLFRFLVEEIHEGKNFKKMLMLGDFSVDVNEIITKDEIKILQEKLKQVDISPVLDSIVKMRDLLKVEMIEPSSRRFKWALQALKARALLNKRLAVESDDLYLLTHILWTDKKEIHLIETTLLRSIESIGAEIKELYDQAVEIVQICAPLDPDIDSESLQIKGTVKKLNAIFKKIEHICETKTITPKVTEISQKLMHEINKNIRNLTDKMFK